MTGDGTTGAPVVLETNVDDLDQRLWPGVLARLIEAGAVDAWLTPILMKKGRPAYTLSALVPADAVAAVRRVVFVETSSIGVREHTVAKHALDRDVAVVQVDGYDVRVKTATLDESGWRDAGVEGFGGEAAGGDEDGEGVAGEA